MHNSKYWELRNNPPAIKVEKENPREVHFYLRSVMCDNESKIVLKRKEDGQYSVNAGNQALSNFQMKGDYKTDLVWAAEDGNWNEVVDIINTGTVAVENVRYR
mgnify:CR=1 FL=1